MKMDYQAPEVEMITLVAEEVVTDGVLDGEQGTTSNMFPGVPGM